MTDEPTDHALLVAHAAGDSDAFAELFRRHRDRMWAVAVRTIGNREDAADAVQDAFIKAMRSVGSFRGDCAVSTWLYRIVVNVCLDQLRAAKRRPTQPLLIEPSTSPDSFDQQETSIVVHNALLKLGEEQRFAIVLVDLHGLAVSEAADILGVAEGTIKSRCARGRARLAELLESLRPASGDTTHRNSTGTPDVPSTTTSDPNRERTGGDR